VVDAGFNSKVVKLLITLPENRKNSDQDHWCNKEMPGPVIHFCKLGNKLSQAIPCKNFKLATPSSDSLATPMYVSIASIIQGNQDLKLLGNAKKISEAELLYSKTLWNLCMVF
jgi:hypothetical protein